MFKKYAIAAALCSAFATPTLAEDASLFSISGFGTVAATHFSRNDIDFAGGTGVQHGVGRAQQTSFAPDSKAGLQMRFTPINRLDLTVQALAKENARHDWTPSLEWANAKYSFNDTAAIRIGRICHPFFMISDSRQVNYTNVALRPSIEVYNQVALTSSDVVEGLFKFDIGQGQLNLQGGVGKINADAIPSAPTLRDHDTIKVRKLAYVNGNYEIGPWNFRVGYSEGDLNYDALSARKSVFDTLSNFGRSTGANIRNQWEIQDAKSSFTGLGAVYDDGKFVATGEYVMLRSGKSFNDSDAWNLLGGYRVGKFTPYVSYGAAKTKNRIQVSGVAAAMTPYVGAANAAALQAGIQSLADASVHDQNTASIGVRWDFYKNLALKAQYDRITVKDPSTRGFLINPSSSYPTRAGGDVVAVSLDFVF